MDDLISRRDAIYAAVEAADEWDGEMNPERAKIIGKAILNLPSAHPEQRTGKWITMSDADGVYYCCSECGEDLYREWPFNRSYDLFPRKKSIDKTKYCPNCGARMNEVGNE